MGRRYHVLPHEKVHIPSPRHQIGRGGLTGQTIVDVLVRFGVFVGPYLSYGVGCATTDLTVCKINKTKFSEGCFVNKLVVFIFFRQIKKKIDKIILKLLTKRNF